jgi:hypothetical protein
VPLGIQLLLLDIRMLFTIINLIIARDVFNWVSISIQNDSNVAIPTISIWKFVTDSGGVCNAYDERSIGTTIIAAT